MPEVVEQVPANDPDASGAELLWQPDNSKLYIALLQETNRDEIIEASLGALLNLTSGVWQVICTQYQGLSVLCAV